MMHNVLVPTDGSEGSMRAAEQAAALSAPFEATVHGLTVIPPVTRRDRLRTDPQEVAETALTDLETVVQEAGLEYVSETRRGAAHRQIVKYADEHDVDLIVMGTHGRSGIDHALIGSVAERTVRSSNVPVLTVPPQK